MQVRVQPDTDRFDPADERWHAQVAEFYRVLQQTHGAAAETRVEPGTKGAASDGVILALGSAGAFTAAVEFLKAWLGRDKTRKLRITWDVGDTQGSVTCTGDNIDNESLQRLAEAVGKRLAG